VSATTVTELTAGRRPVVATTLFDLAPLGYAQAEFALSGTAAAYERVRADVRAIDHADFTTRVLVYRPTDPARFNGTVWVEWLNVSGGLDAGPDWTFAHTEFMRAGAAWVGVSCQHLGIHGGDGLVLPDTGGLRGANPTRYEMLQHPGDRFSYDVYSQAGAAVRTDAATLLPGLTVERVLAIGESQSAFRLTTYVNDIDAEAQVYDAFFVHARGGPDAPLDDDSPAISFERPPVPFRGDLRVPVMCVEAETDLIVLGYLPARQPDDDRLVTWEIAGTSHADVYTFGAGMIDTGALPIAELAAAWTPRDEYFGTKLKVPVNAGPQHYVMNAAVAHLERWVRDGVRPPDGGERLAIRIGKDKVDYQPDDHGNAIGGVRTPHVDVPVAVLSGLGNAGGDMAHLCGRTVAFAPKKLRRLYRDRADYLARFAASTADAVARGHLLAADEREISALAEALCPDF